MTDELTNVSADPEAVHPLPAWLTAEFPEHLPHSVVSYKDDQFHVSHDGSKFDSVIEACEYVETFQKEYQLELDDNLDGNAGDLIGGFLLCDITDGSASGRVLFSALSEEAEHLITRTFSNWMDFASGYEENADDFVFAHHFVANHPVFWTKRTAAKTFDWMTTSGIGHLNQTVWKESDGSQHVMFEAGAHVMDSYQHCARDERLVAIADGYEEALILMAKKVHEHFHNDGNERKPV